MVDAPLEKSPFQFAVWSYTTHFLTSTQGLILAFLYCFRNGEVSRNNMELYNQVPSCLESLNKSFSWIC